jgi:oxalate decarboxylase/phosphoglucose isomerase-like protein (cupin superfamily)
MVDLSTISGLPIQLDEETNSICYDDQIKCQDQISIALEEILPVLLNKFIKYPETVYRRHRKVYWSDFTLDDLSYDLYILPPGLLGIEYIKTHIYYSIEQRSKYACFVEVTRGEVTVIIQKNRENEDEFSFNTFVEEIDIIRLHEGDRVAIPTGVFYTFVNTSGSQAVFAVIFSSRHQSIDYSILQKEKGMAFYIISKNARLEIVANPKYKVEQKPIYTSLKNLEESRKQRYKNNVIDQDIPLAQLLKTQTKSVVEMFA